MSRMAGFVVDGYSPGVEAERAQQFPRAHGLEGRLSRPANHSTGKGGEGSTTRALLCCALDIAGREGGSARDRQSQSQKLEADECLPDGALACGKDKTGQIWPFMTKTKNRCHQAMWVARATATVRARTW